MQRRCFADETLSCPELHGNRFTNLKRYIIIKSLCFDITQPKEENLVLVTLIESVYNFLWGRSAHSAAGRRDAQPLPYGHPAVYGGHLFHTAYPAASDAAVPGYAGRCLREKAGEAGRPFVAPDAGGLHRYPVGMGNLVGVVAAVSVGGAGAVFWMWVTALLGGVHFLCGVHAGAEI